MNSELAREIAEALDKTWPCVNPEQWESMAEALIDSKLKDIREGLEKIAYLKDGLVGKGINFSDIQALAKLYESLEVK